jgi:hypothetical protein
LCGCRFVVLVGSVVAQLEQVDELVGIVVEEDCRAGLALEVHGINIFAGHLQDLDLNFRFLVDGFLDLLCIGDFIIDLSLYIKIDLPRAVGHCEFLVLLLQFSG